jgi:hypothetical protein
MTIRFKRFLFLAAIAAGVSTILLAAVGGSILLRDEMNKDDSGRWTIKTLTDPDAAKVDFTPHWTTIKALNALPIPPTVVSQKLDAPRTGEFELMVWRVRARVRAIEPEKDGDFHVVLEEPDDPSVTMITEIPKPWENFRYSVRWWKLRFAAYGFVGKVVVVEGVGFYDLLHNQNGVARNAVELHPVLAVAVEK